MATSNMEDSSSVDTSFQYTPGYCEENVYLLCKKLCSDGVTDVERSDLFVVFISNENKQIPLWHQKASKRADGIILWDYHVICIQRKRGDVPHRVWDLDSSLSLPSPIGHYISEAVRPSFKLFPEYKRLFRIVHAPMFLRFFASDRRHMKDSAGNWTSQPPPYEPIVAEDGTMHNLDEYININSTEVASNVGEDLISRVFSQKFGVVVSESQLDDFFSLIS